MYVCFETPFPQNNAIHDIFGNFPKVSTQYCYNQLRKYLRHCTVFWLNWPVHGLVVPLSNLLAIQDHAQNLEEQL